MGRPKTLILYTILRISSATQKNPSPLTKQVLWVEIYWIL